MKAIVLSAEDILLGVLMCVDVVAVVTLMLLVRRCGREHSRKVK